MPLYTDANYYYSGGSSQLYSPYYPASSAVVSTSSGIYSPYSSTYNRAITGSYVVPITTTRSTGYSAPHGLSASRYQPKLSTITETSPLISSSRHMPLTSLTRIQSPKYTSYATPNHVHTPKYIPPRPILINTADIDVSANRYRKRKEETLRQAQKASEYTSPSSSVKRQNITEPKEEKQPKLTNEALAGPTTIEVTKESSPEQHINRSTIKRNRAVVRLSTIRSRSKDRNKPKTEDSSSPEPEKKLKDFSNIQSPEEVSLKWREKLAEDLAAMPLYPNKKSPGEVLREKYLIQDSKDVEDYAAQCRAQRLTADLPKETMEEVVMEIDSLHHTVKRLSTPQCPTFHDICEDISSDKIDDDLNAGALRRRASIIQCQEQELLNELQKSASGTFQMITMERCASHDSVEEMPHKRHSRRSSKKGKKIKTKITAIVGVENATHLGTILQENEEDLNAQKSPKPKFTANVDSIEEHHEIHKVFKLPKKKSIKRVAKVKDTKLPEGFMCSLPKPQISPKKKFIKPAAEVFTFDEKLIEQTALDGISKSLTQTPLKVVEEKNAELITKKDLAVEEKNITESTKALQASETTKKPATAKTVGKSSIELKTSTLPEASAKTEETFNWAEKKHSINVELKSPTLPKNVPLTSLKATKNIAKISETETCSLNTQKTASSLENLSKSSSNKILNKTNTSPLEVNTIQDLKQASKTLQPSHNESKSKLNKLLDQSSSINIELKSPTKPKIALAETVKEGSSELKVATPKPIKKTIIRSDSGEDFWAQIGTRETLYMNKRKKQTVESQWKKREDLLESTNEEEVKNLEEIKSLVTSQKIEALKNADECQNTTKNVVTRSNSNESALKKDSPIKSKKQENKDHKIVSPLAKNIQKTTTDDVPKTPVMAKDLKIGDGKLKTNDKLEIKKTPVVTKMTTETSLLATPTSSPSSPVTKSISTTTTSTTTTSPKIIGHQAKSPEQQESAEQNKFFPTSPAKSNNNKNETDINKAKAINEQQQLAKTFTLPKENTKITTTTSAANKIKSEAAATKQPETKQPSAAAETNNGVAKSKTADTVTVTKTKIEIETKTKTHIEDKKSSADKETEKTNTKPPTPTATKTSFNAINVDKFLAMLPDQTNASPVKEPTTTTATTVPATTPITPSTTSSNITSAAKASDKKKTTTTTSTNQTNPADTATTTTIKTTANADDNQQNYNKIKDKITANKNTNTNNNNNNNDNGNDETNNNSSTCGGNLSKFATVSNLAQCLHDVDADLADYLPSSAEISENEDYKTDDSDFDYSSIDGWEKLTPSMKKKVKQRRRKEKQAEQARFDPQKKVKIDTTRKLYVKDEAPRFPLVATPRPLWKREKIVYPDDSEDESDSEESGSTEETEDSDECSTSEEYEDELHPTPARTAGGGVKSDSGTSGDGGVSDTNKDSSIIRMSTCSNDSGFEGGTAPSSPKKMLECDVNCHKKCERLTANLCGVNQKLIVEALANVKRGARETRDSPITPPSANPDYRIEAIEEQNETSYTYSQFQKSGRFTPPATIIPRFKNYTVDDFHFLAVLGKGSFGKVLLAELRDTTYYYAVKCLKKDVVLEDDDVDSTLIERKVLALGTKHPYLCHLFCTFQTESHLFFVMEYLNGGDLMFHIQESGRFTEERARFYGAEIVSGLKFLHKKGIIYRDLKLDNVLLDYEGHVRIADFGMCKLQIYLDKTADSFCGTPDYMAPEIIKGDKYNQNVDWWSFGVLLYEMLIGQSPFSGCDEDELFWSICNELPWFPVYISAEATSILKGLLEKDYTKRVGSQYSPAGDIVEHIFFRPIDWNLLEKRQIEPPFRPQVKHPLDTQYFDRVFTRERVRLTPIDKDILQSMDQKQFLGFTYTNPHITLD